MNYAGKKVAITGWSGFLGSQLLIKLEDAGADVRKLSGDVRNGDTFGILDYSYDYLFHFAAPSSQVLFGRKPTYCIESTMRGFFGAAKAAAKFGIRLIYPSTGLLSSGRFNEYAMCKKLCEDYARGLGGDTLGLRIFATYGPGEGHKADYASVPYLFARDAVNSNAPVVYGDGSQTRDFIYVDDAVNAILRLAEECYDPVVDVGSGESISFRDVIAEIAAIVPNASAAEYVKVPRGYVVETHADISQLLNYYTPRVTFSEGIANVVNSLKEERPA